MGNDYATRMRHRRRALKMTQTELGRACGLSHAAICRFEDSDDICKPSLASLDKISEALKCSADYLLGKKEYDLVDLLADARMVEMLEGIQNFSEEQTTQLLGMYEFLKYQESLRLESRQGIHPSETTRVSDKGVA